MENGRAIAVKDLELKIISELMKNSRRSDRELARAVGSSQPTISRTIAKLEKIGIIKEYTMLPDFRRLGYKIMAVIFLKLGQQSHTFSPEELEKMREASRRIEKNNPCSFLLVMNGMGLGWNMVVISFFHDYSEYAKYIQTIKSDAAAELRQFFEPVSVESFLVDLDENTHYLPLTLSRMANEIEAANNEKKEEKGNETGEGKVPI